MYPLGKETKKTQNNNQFMAKKSYIESETLELKSTLSEKEEILETISAFSNTKGGKIFIGINPSDKIIGVDIGSNTLENLANNVKNNTDPKVFPTIEIQQINSKKVVVVSVPEYPAKPVFVKDKVFIRVGRTNQRASSGKIRQLIKWSEQYYWDKQIIPKVSIKEIDKSKIKAFLNKAEVERNILFEGSKSAVNILEKLKLVEKNKITNASVLLFGKNPQHVLYRSIVKCGRFRGTEPIDFIDMQNIEGTIIEQVPSVLNFISRHINISVKITGSPQREEIWEFPKDALREAVINAVCHRNYEDSGNVQIRIFDDRLEVWNPGELPPEITIESLKKTHVSKPRNELIAKCFYLIKYIEQWGTGTNRIVRLCKEAGLPEPEFNLTAGSFVVTFYRNKDVRDRHFPGSLQVGEQVGEQAGEQAGEQVGKDVKKLLEYCKIPRTKKEILSHIDKTNVYLNYKRHIRPLVENEYLALSYPGKPNSPKQKYVITERGKQILNS